MKVNEYDTSELHYLADSIHFTIIGLKESGIVHDGYTVAVLKEFHKTVIKNIQEKKNEEEEADDES